MWRSLDLQMIVLLRSFNWLDVPPRNIARYEIPVDIVAGLVRDSQVWQDKYYGYEEFRQPRTMAQQDLLNKTPVPWLRFMYSFVLLFHSITSHWWILKKHELGDLFT